MDANKCKTCKWRVVMSFCDGKHTDPAREMCHWNWKECAKVRPDECHYNVKREEVSKDA